MSILGTKCGCPMRLPWVKTSVRSRSIRPILRALCEGWDTTVLHPRLFPAHFAYPTLRKKREGWGTQLSVLGQWRASSSAALVFLAMTASLAQAQKPVVLDHVVAVINGSVILESDVQEEMRLAVLQPFTDPGRNTPKRALQRLIDRDLILQQMRTAEELTPPSPEEVQQRVNELRSLIPECTQYHCETDAGWQ